MDALASSAEGFTHVRVIVGMVLGLSLARLVNGLTRFVQHPGSVKIYPIHLGWAFFLIVYTMLYAALTALLFPDQITDYQGYEHYFEARKRWFYGVLALTFIFDIGDTLIKGQDYFASLGTEYILRQCLFAAAAITAMFVKGRRFQLLFLVVGAIYQISWIIRVYDLL